ncbi:translation initiation factor eIF4E [Nucella lapillus]
MWFFKNDKGRNWCENLRLVTKFSTVEDFWGLYNHIQKASKLPTGCDYSVFKDGIEPMWEDEQNKKGGRWLVNMNKSQRHNDLDNVWQEILLCLIGEAFEEQSDEICGAVVNVRNKGDKLGIWTRDFNRQDVILKIGRTLKERLNMPKNCIMGYQAHTDTISKTGSSVKNRYQL